VTTSHWFLLPFQLCARQRLKIKLRKQKQYLEQSRHACFYSFTSHCLYVRRYILLVPSFFLSRFANGVFIFPASVPYFVKKRRNGSIVWTPYAFSSNWFFELGMNIIVTPCWSSSIFRGLFLGLRKVSGLGCTPFFKNSSRNIACVRLPQTMKNMQHNVPKRISHCCRPLKNH
jgi:hypothetical protein